MNKLPTELVDLIYEYEGKYINNKKKLINQLNLKIDYFQFYKNTILEASFNYLDFLNQDDIEYYNTVQNESFSHYYLYNTKYFHQNRNRNRIK